MKTHLTSLRYRRSGFTLVELLVVIAIIASLAAISSVMVMRMKDNARDLTSSAQMHQTVMAAESFEEDYGHLPFGSVIYPDQDTTAESNSDFVATVLNDLTGEVPAHNIREKVYLELSSDHGGITRNTANAITKWVNPWGDPYLLTFDYNLDRSASISGSMFYSGSQIHNQSLIILCPGRDHLFNDKKDNLSWK